jgi:hypothetical protein
MNEDIKNITMKHEKLRKNLRYGDIKRISQALGVSTNTVYKVLRGDFHNEQVLKSVKILAEKRDKELNDKLQALQNS